MSETVIDECDRGVRVVAGEGPFELEHGFPERPADVSVVQKPRRVRGAAAEASTLAWAALQGDCAVADAVLAAAPFVQAVKP